MTASVLVTGKLFHNPEAKTSGAGNDYVTATIKDGQGDDVTWWRVRAFHTEAREELLSLRNGDSVAVSGSFKAEVYDRDGKSRISLSVTADRLISAKRQKRERDAERRTQKGSDAPSAARQPFDDAVPF